MLPSGVYLHDPRCICREAKTKTRRKNKDDTALDAIFWPIMPYNLVAQKLDNTRQPHVIQHYVVPVPQQDQYRHHDQSVYSMWMHFVDFCLANADPLGVEKATVFSAPDLPVNAYTKQSRLAIFRQLSSTPASSTSTTPSKAASNTTSTTKVRENNQVMGAGLTSMKLVQVPVLAISRLEGNSQSHLASPARKVVNSLVDAENDEYNSSGPPMSTKAQGMPLVHRNRESFDSLESLSSSEAAHSRRNSIDSESYFPSHDGYPVYLDNTENDSDARTSPDGSNSNWGSVHSKDVEVHFASSHSYPSTSIAQSFAHQNMVNHAHHQVIHHHQQQQLHHYGHHGGSATIQMLKHRAELHPSHSMGRSMPTSMMDYNNHYY